MEVNAVRSQRARIDQLGQAFVAQPEAMEDVALLALVLLGLVDSLADDVEEAFVRGERELERGAVGLFEVSVVDEPAAGLGHFNYTDFDGLFRVIA